MKVLIIVPAYNEEENLPVLIPKIHECGWDSLVINDGSTDNTEKLLREKGYNHLNMPNNIGLAAVTHVGFLYACEKGYDAACVVDGDGQHPPIYIDILLKELENGTDYVVGSRFKDQKKPFTLRMIGSRLISAAIFLKTGVHINDPTSGMRAIGKRVLSDFAENMNFVAEPDALTYVIRRHYKTKEIQVSMEERSSGESYFSNIFRSIQYMTSVLVSIIFLQW